MSSAEGFVLMMKQVPGWVLAGATTRGSSGNPLPHDLGNGVRVQLPPWRAMTADGQALEGVGIAPDIVVKTSPETLRSGDPVIDAARRHLSR